MRRAEEHKEEDKEDDRDRDGVDDRRRRGRRSAAVVDKTERSSPALPLPRGRRRDRLLLRPSPALPEEEERRGRRPGRRGAPRRRRRRGLTDDDGDDDDDDVASPSPFVRLDAFRAVASAILLLIVARFATDGGPFVDLSAYRPETHRDGFEEEVSGRGGGGGEGGGGVAPPLPAVAGDVDFGGRSIVEEAGGGRDEGVVVVGEASPSSRRAVRGGLANGISSGGGGGADAVAPTGETAPRDVEAPRPPRAAAVLAETIEEKAAREAGVDLGRLSSVGGNGYGDAFDNAGDSLAVDGTVTDREISLAKSRIIPPEFESKFEDVYAKGDDSTTYLPIFWHILKSGGTSTKTLYSKCMHLVEASEIGAHGNQDKDEYLRVVTMNNDEKFVNVDPTQPGGLKRAARLGLVQSRLADVAFTPLLYESVQLFSGGGKGRLFAMFRHPIERSTSLFYYRQTASWERTYDPTLADLTVEEYAMTKNVDNNWVTRSLVSKRRGGKLTTTDLFVAKDVLQRKFLVGLTSRFDESWERFNRYFGWKDDSPEVRRCKDEFLHGGDDDDNDDADDEKRKKKKKKKGRGTNRNVKHKKVEPGSLAWERLKQNQLFDLQLYEFVAELFERQAVLV